MAHKHKQRSSPLDDPPTASSSEEEEEDQQPSSQQHEADEEVASSEEQEEDASSEEEEDDDEGEEDQSHIPVQPPSRTAPVPVPVPVPVPAPPPPPPTNSHPKPSSSESETESDSGSYSEPESNPPTHAKVKPLASKPMEQVQKAKVQPSSSLPPKSGLKRAVENSAHSSDPKRAKKKVTDSSASDEEVEEDGKKSGDVSKKSQRLWSEEDQIAILRGMVDFTSNTGQDPLKYGNDFLDFIKKSLHVQVSSNQLKEKMRRLKKKFEINAAKLKNGDGIKFPKPHDHKAFELSKKVWGTEHLANGVIETSKSNGKVAKTPKKEGGSKNVASAKKLKPETKPESEPASVDLKQSGMMDIDKKPDGDTSLLLSELSRFQNGACVYGLNENEVKRGLKLIGESKRAELEGKWKKLRTAEAELFANRALLVGEQTRLILEALDSSNH